MNEKSVSSWVDSFYFSNFSSILVHLSRYWTMTRRTLFEKFNCGLISAFGKMARGLRYWIWTAKGWRTQERSSCRCPIVSLVSGTEVGVWESLKCIKRIRADKMDVMELPLHGEISCNYPLAFPTVHARFNFIREQAATSTSILPRYPGYMPRR